MISHLCSHRYIRSSLTMISTRSQCHRIRISSATIATSINRSMIMPPIIDNAARDQYHGINTMSRCTPRAAVTIATSRQYNQLQSFSSLSSSSSSSSSPAASSSLSSTSIPSDYSSLLHRLLTINIDRKLRMGVETTSRLLSALGSAYDINSSSIPIIHVAGSNGKGSTALKIAHAFSMHGIRVGLYTSPHISSFRERMVVDGEEISESEICNEEMLPLILQTIQRDDIPATFFEIGTVLAFGFFMRRKCDLVVLEVGLGGRLDSTNVITSPAVSVITSISLEHTQWLGNTVEAIAAEKAGIIKPHCPVVIGPHVPRDTALQIARERQATSFVQLQLDTNDYDEENSAIAAEAIRVASQQARVKHLLHSKTGKEQVDEMILQQAVKIRPHCRFEQVRWLPSRQCGVYTNDSTTWLRSASDMSRSNNAVDATSNRPGVDVILDVCHNPHAFQRLFDKLAALTRPALSTATSTSSSTSTSTSATGCARDIIAVVGFSSDKDFTACLDLLMQHCKRVCIVQADSQRAARADDVIQSAREQGLFDLHPSCHLSILDPSPFTTLSKLLNEYKDDPQPPLILCCGTFFIMSDIRRALRLPHPIDPVATNEQSMKKG